MSKRPVKTFAFGDGEYFRNLKGREIAQFLDMQENMEGNSKIIDIYAFIMCKCLCDQDGVRTFADDEIEECKSEDFGDLKSLAEKVMDNIGLVEEVKNLEATP